METQTNPQETDQLVDDPNTQLAAATDALTEQPEAETDASDAAEDSSDVASHVQIEVILDEIASLSEPDQLVGDDAQPVIDRTSDANPEPGDEGDTQRSDTRGSEWNSAHESDRVSDRIVDRSTDRAPTQLADRVTDQTQATRVDPASEVDPLEGGRMSRGIRSYLENPAERDGVHEISLVMNHDGVKDFSRAGGSAWDNSIFNRAAGIATDEPAHILDVAQKQGHDKQDDHRRFDTDVRVDQLQDRVEELVDAVGELVDVLTDAIGSIAAASTTDSEPSLADVVNDILSQIEPDPASSDLLADAITLVSDDAAGTDPFTGTAPVDPVPGSLSDAVTDVSVVTVSDVLTDLVAPEGSIDPLLDVPNVTDTVTDGANTSSPAVDSVTDFFADTTLANDSDTVSLIPVQEQVPLIA